MPCGGLDYSTGYRFTEEHDVGLEQSAALLARGYRKRGEIANLQIGVAVGRVGGVKIEPVGIEPAEAILHLLAHHLQSAPHAADQVEPAVQVDHAVVAGGLMGADRRSGSE